MKAGFILLLKDGLPRSSDKLGDVRVAVKKERAEQDRQRQASRVTELVAQLGASASDAEVLATLEALRALQVRGVRRSVSVACTVFLGRAREVVCV